MDIDIGLYTFIVDLEDFQPSTVFPRIIFQYLIEDWELPMLDKNNGVTETELLENYNDMVFNDIGNKGVTYGKLHILEVNLALFLDKEI